MRAQSFRLIVIGAVLLAGILAVAPQRAVLAACGLVGQPTCPPPKKRPTKTPPVIRVRTATANLTSTATLAPTCAAPGSATDHLACTATPAPPQMSGAIPPGQDSNAAGAAPACRPLPGYPYLPWALGGGLGLSAGFVVGLLINGIVHSVGGIKSETEAVEFENPPAQQRHAKPGAIQGDPMHGLSLKQEVMEDPIGEKRDDVSKISQRKDDDPPPDSI